MRRILAGLAVVGMLAVASPAQAQGDYYQRSISVNKPFSVTWEHTSNPITVYVQWGTASVPMNLDVTGPNGAECHAVIQPTEATGSCHIQSTPLGFYTATVSVASGSVKQVFIIVGDN